jgi:antitoxin component HigA of HigAB toxin-antitoxin module
MNFSVVITSEKTEAIQTDNETFHYDQRIQDLAEDATRLLKGEKPQKAEAQAGQTYRLTSRKTRKFRWFNELQLSRIAKHKAQKRKSFPKDVRNATERKFLEAFYSFNPAPQSQAEKDNTKTPHPWVAAIEAARFDQDLTHSDLREAFGVETTGAVSHYLSERRYMTIEQFIRVSVFLGIDPCKPIREYQKSVKQEMESMKSLRVPSQGENTPWHHLLRQW